MDDDKAYLRTIVNQDGAAVLDTKRGTISTLNPTGAYIWQALEQGQGKEEIIDGLARETGESPDVIRHDLDNFIAALHENSMFSR